MNMPLVVPAPAKLNLFLHVTGRREDGYHTLQTLFQLLDHGDLITLTPRADTRIVRTSALPGVPAEADLVVRAAEALAARATPPFGVDIDVIKQLPMGGGLGGGSSDAASVLVGLNALWGLALSRDALARIGLGLGADVPVFVHARTAFAQGVGEELTPVVLPERAYLVLHPGCEISTAHIFSAPALTRDTPRLRIADLSHATTRNDCEPVVRDLFPAVASALDWLTRHLPPEAGGARLTGTGACVFAALPSLVDAEALLGQALMAHPDWEGFVARGVNRSPLEAALVQAGLADVGSVLEAMPHPPMHGA